MVTVNLVKMGSRGNLIVNDPVDMSNVLSIRFEFDNGDSLEICHDSHRDGLTVRAGSTGSACRIAIEPSAVNTVLVKPIR